MKFALSLKTGRWIGCLLLIVLCASALRPGDVRGQSRWLQNVELITPVKDGYATQVMLDTLTYVLQNNQVNVQRTPKDGVISFTSLENALLNEGLDFISATHLFIGYRLEANQRNFTSNITHLYFIYRPQDFDGIDTPIMYVDATQPAIQKMLETSGTPMLQNEAAVLPFMEQLTFHKLPESSIVSVGNRVIRDPAEAKAEKERLLGIIRRFLFQ